MSSTILPAAPGYRFYNRPFYDIASDEELAQLSEQDRGSVQSFRRDGYLQFDAGIDSQQLDSAAQYVRKRCFDIDTKSPAASPAASSAARLKEQRVVDGWTQCDAILSIAQHPEILRKLELLYGRRPFPFQTLNFPVGSQQRTHSDGVHFNTVPSRFMCGVWVALEDIEPDSGPLHYYANSHQLPDISLYETFDGKQSDGAYPSLEDYYLCYEDYVERLLIQQKLKKVEVCLKKGQVFIWSAGLCHGGSPVTNPDSTRLSQVTHMFFDDCVYYSPRRSHNQIGRLWLREVLDVQNGQRVDHVFADQRMRVESPGPYRISAQGKLVRDQSSADTKLVRRSVLKQLLGKLRAIASP